MSETIPSEAVIWAWTRLVAVQQRVLAAVEGELAAAGLPPLGWYDALLELRREGEAGLRPMALQERLLVSQPNVSRLLDRLARAGLIERRPCPDDRRGQLAAITPAGRELLARMWPVYRAAIQRHVGQRIGTDEDALLLGGLLDRLVMEEDREATPQR